MDQGEFVVKFKTAPDASIVETRGRLEAGARGARRSIPEVDVHLRLDRRRRRGHRPRRAGLREARRPERAETAPRRSSCAEVRRAPRRDPRHRRSSVQDDPDAFQKPLQIGRSAATTSPTLKKYAASSNASCTRCPASSTSRLTLEHDLPEYRLIVDRRAGRRDRASTPALWRARSARWSAAGGLDLRGRGRRSGRRARAAAGAIAPGRHAGRRPADRGADAGRTRSLVPLADVVTIHARDLAGGDQPAGPRPAGGRRRQPRRPAARHGR